VPPPSLRLGTSDCAAPRDRVTGASGSSLLAKTVPASSYEMPSRPTRRITWRCSSEFERERDRDRAMTAALSDRLALYQIRSSYPPMFSTKCQPSTAPQREWGRRNLDYGEAQSFQDLLLCRSPRMVGDELHAGLAGSSWISVQDLQTHPHDPSARTPIEHASELRSRVASENTYGGQADAKTSRQEPRPGLPPSSERRSGPC
jgi:hypothetical protein